MAFSDQPKRIAKFPFIIGDLLLLGMAGWIIWDAGGLPGDYLLMTVVGCLVVGMFFSVLPFLLDYRAELKREEINEFQNVAEQLKSLRQLEEHIRHATSQWQAIQDHCLKTVENADQIAQSMSQESQRFAEVMQSMDVSEKEHLRVEAEKLRRSEKDWLQSIVRVLDHVFALHKAALQSGQAKLINQITNFQHAVTDVVRRMGLTQHLAEAGALYDSEIHQILNNEHEKLSEPAVAETLAAGFTFQGRMVRLPLVRLVEKASLPPLEGSSEENLPQVEASVSADDQAGASLDEPISEVRETPLDVSESTSEPDSEIESQPSDVEDGSATEESKKQSSATTSKDGEEPELFN